MFYTKIQVTHWSVAQAGSNDEKTRVQKSCGTVTLRSHPALVRCPLLDGCLLSIFRTLFYKENVFFQIGRTKISRNFSYFRFFAKSVFSDIVLIDTKRAQIFVFVLVVDSVKHVRPYCPIIELYNSGPNTSFPPRYSI